jgi:hypothetical protein
VDGVGRRAAPAPAAASVAAAAAAAALAAALAAGGAARRGAAEARAQAAGPQRARELGVGRAAQAAQRLDCRLLGRARRRDDLVGGRGRAGRNLRRPPGAQRPEARSLAPFPQRLSGRRAAARPTSGFKSWLWGAHKPQTPNPRWARASTARHGPLLSSSTAAPHSAGASAPRYTDRYSPAAAASKRARRIAATPNCSCEGPGRGLRGEGRRGASRWGQVPGR